MNKWIVNVKGRLGDNFEISVVREDNEHGILSYGWFDDNKLLISHNGGPCPWSVTSRIWNGLMELASVVASELNMEAKK